MQKHELEILLDRMAMYFLRPGDVVSFKDDDDSRYGTIVSIEDVGESEKNLAFRYLLTIEDSEGRADCFKFWHEVKRVGSFTRTPGIPSIHPCETETD